MKAVLRRAAPEDDEQLLVLGDVTLQRSAREVLVAGETVELRPTEFDLLAYLIENRGIVLRAICCSNGCGATTTRAGHELSMCTWRSCGASSVGQS
jgi:hypothetical protein